MQANDSSDVTQFGNRLRFFSEIKKKIRKIPNDSYSSWLA